MLANIPLALARNTGWAQDKRQELSARVQAVRIIRSTLHRDDVSSGVQKALRERFAGAEPADVVQRSLAGLKEVSAILDAKAPEDAATFKDWVCAISQKVAEASVEGSFLGFGGQRVSDAEKATLSDIAKSLNRTA